jgi:hypothetical protein
MALIKGTSRISVKGEFMLKGQGHDFVEGGGSFEWI